MSRFLKILTALVAIVALGACDSTDPSGTGSLSILLTDDPGDVTQALVRIERIEIVGGSGGPLVVTDEPWEGDLTELTNSFEMIVDAFALPQGTYSQLRVIVSEACIGVDTGEGPDDADVYVSDGASVECVGTEVGELHMPSLSQTGIKVIFQGPIEVSGEQAILLDFDVSESFGKEAGGSGRWVMDPTIHGVDVSFSGTVNLTVELNGVTLPPPTFEDFTASLDGEDLALEADGTASFLYVVPGAYQLNLAPPENWTMTTIETLPIALTVDSGEVEEVTITLETLSPVP